MFVGIIFRIAIIEVCGVEPTQTVGNNKILNQRKLHPIHPCTVITVRHKGNGAVLQFYILSGSIGYLAHIISGETAFIKIFD